MNDTDIIEGAPLVFWFDGKAYKVKPLNIGKARVWKKLLVAKDAVRVKAIADLAEPDEKFIQSVNDLNPDFVLDLVVAYCESSKPIDGETPVTREIIEEGSNKEVASAFQKIVDDVYPSMVVTAGQKALLAAWGRT